MRVLILAIALSAAALLPGVAAAQSCTRTTLGTYTYTNCSDGSSATTTQLGNNTFTNYSDGSSSTRTQLGQYGYTNYSDGTRATSTQLGNYGYTNYSDGTSATTTRLGSTAYTNYSDGTSVTSTRLGGSTSSTVTSNVSAASAPATATASSSAPAPYGAPAYVNGVLYTLPPNLLIKGSGPAIYIVFNGQRWEFSDWPTYLAYGGAPDLSNVLVMRDDELAFIPLGPIVPRKQ